ncbi:hypothetical protein H2201_008451 [Coniosporium apollinis]|uniref:VPS37 C-terminal domain-containing protein n=1 Tax=Coniosporium apollinis TaxID=61459 RepID=A0ABQ9NG67_9PEZI|nr:hypothetical protein H2201_008451 [Coniosporium apollinis]
MSFHSPHHSQSHSQPQFHFNPSTPPPPPPKPSAHSSGHGTPSTGPTLPPLPPGQPPQQPYNPLQQQPYGYSPGQHEGQYGSTNGIRPPEGGWLPAILRDKTTIDLQHVLQTPELQHALVYSPETVHPSIPASTAPLQNLLAANTALAESLKNLESHLQHQRQSTQSRLLALRALEGQWRAKQAEQDAALRDFSPPALYQRLSAAVGEQESLCRGLEESFLDGQVARSDGQATEREVADFLRRYREGRKIAYLRREKKERWDEGRVGGWR